MLVITRRAGERLVIQLGDQTVTILVADVTDSDIGRVKLATEAPLDIDITRVDPPRPSNESPRPASADATAEETPRAPRETRGRAIKGADGMLRLKRSSEKDA